jgi:hypothetical protein
LSRCLFRYLTLLQVHSATSNASGASHDVNSVEENTAANRRKGVIDLRRVPGVDILGTCCLVTVCYCA